MSRYPQQESIDFGRHHAIGDATRRAYREINNAVDILGITAAAGACGYDRADLRRALDRNDRRLAWDHAIAIAMVSPFEVRKVLATVGVEPLGFCIANPIPPMSDRERAEVAESVLRSLGPIATAAHAAALDARR